MQKDLLTRSYRDLEKNSIYLIKKLEILTNTAILKRMRRCHIHLNSATEKI